MQAALRRLLWRAWPPVLALGGGGARGFAHIGVLQVLEEQKLRVRGIAGTSMGAVVGAMYLALGSSTAVTERWRGALGRKLIPSVRSMRPVTEIGVRENPLLQVARKIRSRLVVSVAINRRTMLDDSGLREALKYLLPEQLVEELPLPFVAVATDLENGAEMHLRSGALEVALRASSSIPGLLPAVEVDGRWLVDGGVVAEIPAAAARTLGRRVVAVDVSMGLPALGQDRIALDTMMRTQMMTSKLLRDAQLAGVQPVIRPDVADVWWSDWDRFEELVERGRLAAISWLGLPVPAANAEPDVEEEAPDASETSPSPVS